MFPSFPTRGTYYSDLFSNCCGFKRSSADRRRDFEFIRPNSYIYSPSTAHLDHYHSQHGNSWYNYFASTQHQLQPQSQPYILVPQPVIIAASNHPATNHLNTMTLVQSTAAGITPISHNIGSAASPFHQQQTTTIPALLSNLQPVQTNALLTQQQQQLQLQNQIQQSNYGISTGQPAIISQAAPSTVIGGGANINANNTNLMAISLPNNQNIYEQTGVLHQHQQQQLNNINQPQQQLISCPRRPQTPNVPLSSEIFRQLELLEKQVDLSNDMDLIERFEIVITRALDPYSLMPYLTEATMRKYNNYFLFNDEYVIRFIEVIKRPGQTLGVYMRLVNFDSSKSIESMRTNNQLGTTTTTTTITTRPGFVISKILTDSPIYNSKVLHVGDEIISINLVDIQGMNIDDVVIMMSIPKRLVLAIRIPRERDQLLNYNLMQQQQQLLKNTNIQIDQHQQQQQQRDLNNNNNNWSSNRIQLKQQPQLQAPPLTSMIDRDLNFPLNSYTSYDNNNNLPSQSTINYQTNGGVQQLDSTISDELAEHLPARRFSNSGIGTINWMQTSPTTTAGHRTLPARPSSTSNVVTTSHNLNHEQRLSMSPTSTLNNVNNNNNMNNKTSSVLSNIRLGDTPEQSSYFSSSIDAINRELKELRKQRMALSNNEHGFSETTGNRDETEEDQI